MQILLNLLNSKTSNTSGHKHMVTNIQPVLYPNSGNVFVPLLDIRYTNCDYDQTHIKTDHEAT